MPSAADPPGPAVGERPDGPPAPPGLDPGGLSRLDEMAAAYVAGGVVPGLVVLVARGEEVHVTTAGRLSSGGPSVRRDSLFRIASMTKPIVAVAVMALVAEGLVDLDEPVDRLLPELADRRVLRRPDGPLDDTVPARRPIAVRELLTFTFGFGRTQEMLTAPEPWPVVRAVRGLGLAALGPPDPLGEPDPDTWMARLGSLPLVAQPGERWLYNAGASVAGVLVARAAGQPLGQVLRTRIFEPLGMVDTAWWTDRPERLPTAYLPTAEGFEVWDAPEGSWSSPPAFGDGAAGLLSTVDDQLAFARMFLRDGDPVLSPAAVQEMAVDRLDPAQQATARPMLGDQGWGYCLAVQTRGPQAGAFGWHGGLGTSWLVDPGRDLVVIVFTQRLLETLHLSALHTDLQGAAYGALTRGSPPAR